MHREITIGTEETKKRDYFVQLYVNKFQTIDKINNFQEKKLPKWTTVEEKTDQSP